MTGSQTSVISPATKRSAYPSVRSTPGWAGSSVPYTCRASAAWSTLKISATASVASGLPP